MILQTGRLLLRRFEEVDFPVIRTMLKDAEVMYAYGGAFDDAEADAWITRQLARYEEYDFGLWAVILKETGEMIGQCGVTMQAYNAGIVPEVGYLFRKAFWGKGYASEAAIACKEYAFEDLGFDTVYSIIEENNIPSQKVAERNGMTCTDKFTKLYRGRELPHLVYSVRREA